MMKPSKGVVALELELELEGVKKGAKKKTRKTAKLESMLKLMPEGRIKEATKAQLAEIRAIEALGKETLPVDTSVIAESTLGDTAGEDSAPAGGGGGLVLERGRSLEGDALLNEVQSKVSRESSSQRQTAQAFAGEADLPEIESKDPASHSPNPNHNEKDPNTATRPEQEVPAAAGDPAAAGFGQREWFCAMREAGRGEAVLMRREKEREKEGGGMWREEER